VVSMSPRNIFKAFGIILPALLDGCEGFGTIHGSKNSIRIRRANGRDMIFTYYAHDSWCLEDARTYRKK
jgi:hypothetical protein